MKLAVGHEKRFEPPIQELMRLVKAGELGTPLQIEANFVQDKFLSLPPDNWRLSAKEAPAGPMTATGIHLLDLSVGVFGPAERVFASVRTARQPARERRHARHPGELQERRQRAAERDPRDAFRRPLRRLRQQGLGRGARQGASRGAAGLDADRCIGAASEKTAREYPPAKAVLANLEAFADAATGGAPYPVPQERDDRQRLGARGDFPLGARPGASKHVEN